MWIVQHYIDKFQLGGMRVWSVILLSFLFLHFLDVIIKMLIQFLFSVFC